MQYARTASLQSQSKLDKLLLYITYVRVVEGLYCDVVLVDCWVTSETVFEVSLKAGLDFIVGAHFFL